MKTRERKVDIKTLEIMTSRIENDDIREVLESVVDELKELRQRLAWVEDHAEGVH